MGLLLGTELLLILVIIMVKRIIIWGAMVHQILVMVHQMRVMGLVNVALGPLVGMGRWVMGIFPLILAVVGQFRARQVDNLGMGIAVDMVDLRARVMVMLIMGI